MVGNTLWLEIIVVDNQRDWKVVMGYTIHTLRGTHVRIWVTYSPRGTHGGHAHVYPVYMSYEARI